MKKLIALFLALFLLLPLGRPVSALSINPYIGATYVLKPGSEDVFTEAYDDLDEFNETLVYKYVPDNILLPESVSPIGAFHMIIENTDPSILGHFFQYYYVIRPHNEEGLLYLEVDHVEPFALDENRMIVDISYVSENMAKLDFGYSNNSPRAIIRDEITYLYSGNFLTAVSWQNGDTAFSIRLLYGDQIGKTDYAEGSFMNALLSLDEEKFAYARDILLSLGVEQDENPGTGDDLGMWLVWMPLSLVGMVAVLGFKKRGV